MGQLIDAYVSASELLFRRRATRTHAVNNTTVLFRALLSEDAMLLEEGAVLLEASVGQLSEGLSLPAEEIIRQIDLFLYWRQNTVRYLNREGSE